MGSSRKSVNRSCEFSRWVHKKVNKHPDLTVGGNIIYRFNTIKLATIAHELYDYTKNQGIEFTRGSFTIADKDKKKINALLTCAKSLGDYCYNRAYLSSHYKDSSEQYGIDMILSPTANPIDILPSNMHHILFGYV